jgi:hypothetical protein
MMLMLQIFKYWVLILDVVIELMAFKITHMIT